VADHVGVVCEHAAAAVHEGCVGCMEHCCCVLGGYAGYLQCAAAAAAIPAAGQEQPCQLQLQLLMFLLEPAQLLLLLLLLLHAGAAHAPSHQH
jgi:hypothetical protein